MCWCCEQKISKRRLKACTQRYWWMAWPCLRSSNTTRGFCVSPGMAATSLLISCTCCTLAWLYDSCTRLDSEWLAIQLPRDRASAYFTVYKCESPWTDPNKCYKQENCGFLTPRGKKERGASSQKKRDKGQRHWPINLPTRHLQYQPSRNGNGASSLIRTPLMQRSVRYTLPRATVQMIVYLFSVA